MTLSHKLKYAWKHRKNIVNGWLNTIWPSRKVKQVRDERLAICRNNRCGKYDRNGEAGTAYIPGAESCAVCGCALIAMCSDMESNCSLIALGREPLWKAQNEENTND